MKSGSALKSCKTSTPNSILLEQDYSSSPGPWEWPWKLYSPFFIPNRSVGHYADWEHSWKQGALREDHPARAAGLCYVLGGHLSV